MTNQMLSLNKDLIASSLSLSVGFFSAKPWGWQTLSVRIRLEESGKRNRENLSSYTKVKKTR